jgi:exopolysaccharide production protein ExoY
MEKTIAPTLINSPNVSENTGSRASAGMSLKFRRGAKRVLDVGGAFIFLIAFAPILLGVALLLLLVQGRPILFKHKRIGRKGETFYCLKFRTMVNDSGHALDAYFAANPAARKEWQASQKLKHDPRVTALGHVMRKLSIDELPQFLNVVFGQMSLVGPRPIVASEVRFYGPQISFYESLRPGITGPWQVGGRSNTSYTRRVQLDVDYARNWSLGSDVVILLKTVPAVLTSSGSC